MFTFFEATPIPESRSNLDIPFSTLFPTLSTQFDISGFLKIEVPVDLFTSTSPDDAVNDDVIIVLDQEKPDIPTALEQKFIYALISDSETFDPPVSEKEKALAVWAAMKENKLVVGVRNRHPGFNLLKNIAFFQVYKAAGVLHLLPAEFRTEAEEFLALQRDLVERIETIISAQFEGAMLQRPESEYIFTQLISKNFARSASEVLDIISQGPRVKGFADTVRHTEDSDSYLEDEQVRSFLRMNYPLPVLNSQVQVATVSGSKEIFFMDPQAWQPEVLSQEAYKGKIDQMGLEEVYERTFLSYVTGAGWIDVPTFNMCQDIPGMAERMLASVDYLEAQWSEKQKRIALGLAILAHEFIHRLQTVEVMSAYHKVALSTWGKGTRWQGYPTEYVMFYKTKYEKDDDATLREDLADSVQIYVINSTYLRDQFPERYHFIQRTFPHLQPDSVRQFLSQASSE